MCKADLVSPRPLCSAQAAEAATEGYRLQVYAMSSEDMDSLTFGATRLVRNLMTPASAKIAINEYEYDKVGALSWLTASARG